MPHALLPLRRQPPELRVEIQVSHQVVELARWAPPERVVLATNSVDAVFRAARAGWGIAMLPVISAGSNPELARVLPETEVISLPIWLVTHAELGKSPRIRAVFQHLVHTFERDRDAFAGGSATTARRSRVARP